MARVLYLDCFAGAAGDMLLGALIDLGVPIEEVRRALGSLGLEEGFAVAADRVLRSGVSATKFRVSVPEPAGATHPHRHLAGIEKLNLHAGGALDSIIDIVGAVHALECLGVDEIVSSPLNVGSGTVQCAHGTFPVPAPATAQLLAGVPVYASGPPME